MGLSFYLLLNLLSISFPLLATFDKRIGYFRKVKYILPSIFLVGLVFILWDIEFTKQGIWGFNEQYLMGIDIFHLPIEEWLFFLCIPYASIFIYESLRYFKGGLISSYSTFFISLILGGLLIILGLVFSHQDYTFWTFLPLGLYILLLEFVLKVNWLAHFYVSYLWVLIPFFTVNGLLTGSFIEGEVVWYNNAENFGIRMGTIPIEDTFYGMLLLIAIVHIYESLKKMNEMKKPPF
ncbi:MAG: lycopene cyclase domain-containing protein [Bacteroidota bacterium]